MKDIEIFEAVKQRFTDPKTMDLLRAGLADPEEMEDVKRAIRYGEASMKNPALRDKLYKIFDRLLNVVKDDSTTRQMVKQDLRKLQKGDSDMSEDLNTANVEKAVKHDCAKHVVHEQWGKGQCIPGEHTLLDDGTVTHYDVMFDHGIEQNVAVEDLTVVVSESHMHAKKKKAMEEEAVTPAGGNDTSKASKKGKLEMPLERLKAIMEKKKSEAYKAMLRSQGKMEEEVEQIDENNKSKIKVKSNFEDGYGPVEVHIHHPDGTKKKITSKHWYNEDPGEDNGYSRSEHNEYRAHLEKHHGLSPKESHAVAKHFDKIYKGKATDSDFTYGKHVSEEVEQVDELNKSTLASYVNKAAHQVRAKSGIASSFETQGERKRDPENKAAYANLAKDFRVGAKKRLTGIEKATAKLAKEEVEQVAEKKLTSAEMKKREEVAKAIERDQPGMPMGKKMAIATATAKKVAEELVGNQHKIDANKNNKIDAHDFKLLRAKKKTMKEFVEQLAESLSPKAE
jgi:hypothetical protein